MTQNYTIFSNPVINQLVLTLRDKSTEPFQFRHTMQKLGEYCAYEVAMSLPTQIRQVTTPLLKQHGKLANTKARVIKPHAVGLVCVLRAAVPFVEGFSTIFPDAPIAFLAARRAAQEGMSFTIESNYQKGIDKLANKIVILPDPMLASGSSMLFAIGQISVAKPRKIIVCAAIASVFGINTIARHYPGVDIYTAALDSKLDKGLNSHGYIVPGLGDAGDRSFGTV